MHKYKQRASAERAPFRFGRLCDKRAMALTLAVHDMEKQTNFPIESKAIRFAPGRNQEPLTMFWRIWAQGSDVYALSRTSLGNFKISVHASGQIHWRLTPEKKQGF